MTRLTISGSAYWVKQIGDLAFSVPPWSYKVLDLNPLLFPSRKYFRLLFDLWRAKGWYHIAGNTMKNGTIRSLFFITSLVGKPVVMHWLGSDILYMAQFFKANPQSLKAVHRFIHWGCAPWHVEELRKIGLEAEFVPVPIKNLRCFLQEEPPKLPEQFTILSYVPENKGELYGLDHLLRLAKDVPEANFRIFGGKGESIVDKPSNVCFLGWIDDVRAAYRDCTVLVRMTKHDGYGGTVQEALALGRHAIWTYPFQGALHAPDYPALRQHVQRLLSLHQQGALELNMKGRDFVKSNFHPDLLAAQIQQRMLECLGLKP